MVVNYSLTEAESVCGFWFRGGKRFGGLLLLVESLELSTLIHGAMQSLSVGMWSGLFSVFEGGDIPIAR